jgi:hypothetical protein
MIDKVIDDAAILDKYIAANDMCGVDARKYLPRSGHMTVLLDIAINPVSIFIDDIACTDDTYAYVFRSDIDNHIMAGYISKPIPTDDGQERTTIWSFNPDDFNGDMVMYDINDAVPIWYSKNFARNIYGTAIGDNDLVYLTRTMIRVIYEYLEQNSSDDTIDLLCGHGHHFYSKMVNGHLSVDFHKKKPDKFEYYLTSMSNINNFKAENKDLVEDIFKLAKAGRLDNIIMKGDRYGSDSI